MNCSKTMKSQPRLNRREFLGGAACLAATGAVSAGSVPAEDPRLAAARKLALGEIAAGHCYGVAFSRADKGLYGYVGLQGATPESGPVDALTRFEVASVTKTVVNTVVGRYVAQGRLDPDAPFTDYYRDHALAGTSHGIRIRDLAAHTSGFPYFSGKRLSPDPKVNRGWEGFMEELRTCRPNQPLGTIRYNCVNYCLLAEICVRIGGKPINELAKEMVFDPLGMTRCAWWPQPNDGHLAHMPLVQQDGRERAPGLVHDPPAFHAGRPTGNAGLYADLDGLSRFVRDLLERKAFEKAYYDLVYTTLADDGVSRRTFGWNRSKGGIPEGFSQETIYHTGFTGQTVCVDPEKGFAGVVMTNRRPNDGKTVTPGRVGILAALAG